MSDTITRGEDVTSDLDKKTEPASSLSRSYADSDRISARRIVQPLQQFLRHSH